MNLAEKNIALYCVVSGAGAGFQRYLWEWHPGASQYLIGCSFPYAQWDTVDFLGFEPESYCSQDEVLELAMAAYRRAARANCRTRAKRTPVGLAVTAAVASHQGTRRGNHRIHAAVMTPKGCWYVGLILPKEEGHRARTADGELADDLALALLWLAVGERPRTIWYPGAAPVGGSGITHCGHGFDINPAPVPEETLRALLLKRPLLRHRRWLKAGRDETFEQIVYPGSFNPLHKGHVANASYVAGLVGKPVAYSIDLDPVHKPPLTMAQLLERIALAEVLDPDRDFLVTEKQPLYMDKVRARPSTSWIVGADTLETILDPKWGVPTYDVVAQLMAANAKFYVAHRPVADGYITLGSVISKHYPSGMPQPLQLCAFSAHEYDNPISSSAIRAAGESPLVT